MDEFTRRRRELAQHFLQTGIVVDDAAYMVRDRGAGPNGKIVAPDRRTRIATREDQSSVRGGSEHTLDAQLIMDSFSALGVICGVVGPTDSVMKAMRKADIVVLDWLLRDNDPKYALGLLRGLLAAEADENSLRLVAIYTGESQLEDICAAVVDELKDAGLDPVKNEESSTEISYQHGRVVLYAKSGVNLAKSLKNRSVAEEDLPEKLVADFASMTRGLLTGIALTSLTAVREGAHRVLDRFGADLDPAFLAHRACLPNPDDAERQIVNHVAEELCGLMDNAVAEESPAGADAVECWIRTKGDGAASFMFGDQNLNLDQTIKLANEGLSRSVLRNNAFEDLSTGFSGNEVVGLDEKLAWIMSFRTVYNAPPPILWLGSVVTELSDGNEKYLICMRPRCDCVRLKEETSFFFLPLIEPRKVTAQIVVRLGDTFKRLGIEFDSGGWIRRQFKPSTGNGTVTAAKRESDRGFEFIDTCDKRYTWRGELEAEYAHRIAQNFATTLSRVAVDESEWLRRMAKKGS